MGLSRRDLAALFPALLAGAAEGEGSSLPARVYPFNGLPVKTHPNGSETRQVFVGTTHEGVALELHITTMPPGQEPHPPHHHVHDEMFFVQKGAVDVTIDGNTTTLGPGGVAYCASNHQHGLKNNGQSTAQYFVLAIGRD